jgi:hypothetical protein
VEEKGAQAIPKVGTRVFDCSLSLNFSVIFQEALSFALSHNN